MKTFTRLFITVVAGVLAFSCVTDTTEDLGVNLGEGQSTTIDISLEESRTHLGVKDPGGNEYPLFWSKGDKIAVNGKASDALGEEYHGQAKATYKFTGTLLNYPYNIVYPAPAEGVKAVTAGQQVVTFKTSQAYTAGSFAEGSVPMYGYVEDENDATTLNHLTGVLRFDVKGNGEVLKALVVEVEKGKISGNFDVDCANGTLTAHADATNTVTVTFPENDLALSTTATPIYVAVPAGDYGVVTLTLYTNDGKMMKLRFDSSAKAISAGKVREFPEFEFSSNNEPEEGVFLIYDEVTLRDFATRVNAAEENFDTNYPNAKVVANIELTEPWTSINGYTGTFDGGNHEIVNLDAPLFSTTSATIKNISLQVNINIQEEHWVKTKWDKYYSTTFGALVCTYNGTSISNCSVSGNIEHSTPITNDMNYVISGVVGFNRSTTATYANISNSANIKLSAAFSISAKNLQIGGCFGYIYSATGATDCNNSGDFTFDKEFSITSTNQLLVGGIAGFHNYVTFNRCNNSGDIDIYGTFNVLRFTIGGLFGDYRNRALLNATNSGNITFRKDSSATCEGDFSMIGGIAGMALFGSETSEKCINNGTITIEEGASLTSITAGKNIRIGGCFAHGHSGFTKSTTNNGKIILSGKFAGELDCGGVVGYNNIGVAEANTDGMTNNGALEFTSTASTENLHLGGVIGQSRCASYNLKNNATIEIAGSHKKLYVGGVFGHATSGNETMGNMVSCKDITINATSVDAADYYVGGISGNGTITVNIQNSKVFSNITAPNCANAGMVTGTAYSGSIKATNSHVGGSILKGDDTDATTLTLENYPAYVYGSGVTVETPTTDIEKAVVNADDINWLEQDINSTPQDKAFADRTISTATELIAWATETATATSTEVVALGADIDLTGESWTTIAAFNGTFDGKGHKIIGLTAPLFGNLGKSTSTTITIKNVHLTEVDIEYNGDTGMVGALAMGLYKGSGKVINCSAEGTLTANSNTTYVGGIIGRAREVAQISGLVNKVDVTLDNGADSKTYYIGGCIGDTSNIVNTVIENSTNLGTIEITDNFSATTVYIGGICSRSYGGFDKCKNGSDDKDGEPTEEGKIIFNGTTGGIVIGGVGILVPKKDGNYIVGNATECINYAPITVDGNKNTSGNVFIGGVVANNDDIPGNVENCKNYGAIEFSTSNTTTNITIRVAGVSGGLESSNTISNCENHGAINVTASALNTNAAYIGGVVASSATDTTISNLKNEGNVTVEHRDSGESYIGGVVGKLNSTISDSRCLCNIRAVGFTNVGMITGSTRVPATPLVNNCAVGGSIATSTTAQGEIARPNTIELKAGNYHKYIYGSGTVGSGMTEDDWTGTDNYDGCTFDPTEVAPIPEEGEE